MKVSFFLLNCVLFCGCTTQNIIGTYKTTELPAHGVFQKTLELYCDETFSIRKTHSLLIVDETSFGNWMIKKDTLFLKFDTKHPDSFYKHDIALKLGKEKLEPIFPISRKEFEELYKTIMKNNLTDSFQFTKYDEFKAKYDIEREAQYYELIENKECNR